MKPSQFQFSLKDLLWLVLVCAVGMAWWIDRVKIADRERAAAEREQLAESREAEASKVLSFLSEEFMRQAKRGMKPKP